MDIKTNVKKTKVWYILILISENRSYYVEYIIATK